MADSSALRAVLAHDERVTPLVDVTPNKQLPGELQSTQQSPATRLLSRVLVSSRPAESALDAWRSLGPKGFRLSDAALAFMALRVHARGHARSLKDAGTLVDHTEALLNATAAELARLDRRHARRMHMLRQAKQANSQPLPAPPVVRRAAEQAEDLLAAASGVARGLDAAPSITQQDARAYRRCNDVVIGAARGLRNSSALPTVCAWLSALEAAAADVPLRRLAGSKSSLSLGPMGALACMASDDPVWAARVLLPILDAIRAVDAALARLSDAATILIESDMHSYSMLKEVRGLLSDLRYKAVLPRELAVAVAACPSPEAVAARAGTVGEHDPRVTQRARVAIEACLGATGCTDGGASVLEPTDVNVGLDGVLGPTMTEEEALARSLDSPLSQVGVTTAAAGVTLVSIAKLGRALSAARWFGEHEGRLWTAIGRAAGVAASAAALPRVRPLDPAEVVALMQAVATKATLGAEQDINTERFDLPASFLEAASLEPAAASLHMMDIGDDTENDMASTSASGGNTTPAAVPEGHLQDLYYAGPLSREQGGDGNDAALWEEGIAQSARLSDVLREQEPRALLERLEFDSGPISWASADRLDIEARLLRTYEENVRGPRDGLRGHLSIAGRGRMQLFSSGALRQQMPVTRLQSEWAAADANAKLAALADMHWVHLALSRLSPLGAQQALLDTAMPAKACRSAFVCLYVAPRTSREEFALVRDAAEDSGITTPDVDLVTPKEGIPVSAAWPEARVALDVLRQEELNRQIQSGADLDWTAAAAEGRRRTAHQQLDFARRTAALVQALGPDRIKEAGSLEQAAGRALAQAYAQTRLQAPSLWTSGAQARDQGGREEQKAGRNNRRGLPVSSRRRQASDPPPGVLRQIRDTLTLPVQTVHGHRGSEDGGSFAGRMGRGGALLDTPEGSLLRALSTGEDDLMTKSSWGASGRGNDVRRGRRKPSYTLQADKAKAGSGNELLPVPLRQESTKTQGASELAKALGGESYKAILQGSYVIRNPRHDPAAVHSSLSLRDGTYDPVPRVPDTARVLGGEIRRAREQVVDAAARLKKLLGPSAAREAEDIGLLPTSAPIRGKLEFLPVRQQRRPGTTHGSPVLLPARGARLSLPGGGGSGTQGDKSLGKARSRSKVRSIEGSAGVFLTMPVPGGPIDPTVERETELYAQKVRELERSGGGLVQSVENPGLMMSTPDRLEEHTQMWQLDEPEDATAEEAEHLRLVPRDSKLLEAPSIPLEDQSLEDADVFVLPPADGEKNELVLPGMSKRNLQIGTAGAVVPSASDVDSDAMRSGQSYASGAIAGSGGLPLAWGGGARNEIKGGNTDDRDHDTGSSSRSSLQEGGQVIVSRRQLQAGTLGPDGPKSDTSSGELLVPRLPLATIRTSKAPAMVIAEAQEVLVTALADEHRAIEALKADSAAGGLPPALLRIWTRDGGMSKEEDAFLKQKDRYALPGARLRHDTLRASGWDLVTLPFDHWKGVPEDRRRRLLAMTLPRTVRRPRAPDEEPISHDGSSRGGGDSTR